MLNMVFTTGHEAFTYQKLDMRYFMYTKIYTKYKHNDNKTTWLLLLVVGTTVGPHDFLHPSPIKSALYIVIIFGFLWQIILLTYMRLLTLTLDPY